MRYPNCSAYLMSTAESFVIPSTWAWANCIGTPNAIALIIVALWAASIPSISKVGSASAYPKRWASLRTVLKSRPLSRISDKMKLVVPLMIPAIHSIRLALKPSRKALIIGMPPATAASNATITPLAWAALKISLPWTAIKALLAVTTCLPAAIASSTRSLAIPYPPINSTTISISGFWITLRASSTTSAWPLTSSWARWVLRSATVWMRIPRPARRLISSWLRAKTVKTPLPTVPIPRSPTWMGFVILLLSRQHLFLLRIYYDTVPRNEQSA